MTTTNNINLEAGKKIEVLHYTRDNHGEELRYMKKDAVIIKQRTTIMGEAIIVATSEGIGSFLISTLERNEKVYLGDFLHLAELNKAWVLAAWEITLEEVNCAISRI